MKSCHNDNESHSRSVSLFLLIRSYDLGNPQRPVKYDKQVVVEQDEGVQGVKEKATEVCKVKNTIYRIDSKTQTFFFSSNSCPINVII